jgi:hypothetical protein
MITPPEKGALPPIKGGKRLDQRRFKPPRGGRRG